MKKRFLAILLLSMSMQFGNVNADKVTIADKIIILETVIIMKITDLTTFLKMELLTFAKKVEEKLKLKLEP